MVLALISSGRDMRPWVEAIKRLAPEMEVEIHPHITDPDKVIGAMLWNQLPGMMNGFPNLRWVSSLGAGVEHIINDPSLPKQVQVSRIIDKNLETGMAHTVIMGVLAFENSLKKYYADQLTKTWKPLLEKPVSKVGIMGLGVLGSAAAKALLALGYEVFAYTRDMESVEQVTRFGEGQLNEFLRSLNILVNLLPLTPKTESILNYQLFENCNPGTYVINVARGKHLVEEDLLKALDNGLLSGAYLDVFREEPLPEAHPFWSHPKISVTPHIASITHIPSGAAQIVENFKRLIQGDALLNLVDRERGY